MWTTATSVPERGCPPLVLDKVLLSEDSETLARVRASSQQPDEEKKYGTFTDVICQLEDQQVAPPT